MLIIPPVNFSVLTGHPIMVILIMPSQEGESIYLMPCSFHLDPILRVITITITKK